MPPRFPYTDKDYPHNYLPDYERIAEELGPAATVCEIGVWCGGSLQMWQTLFPDGAVIGVDIDVNCTWPSGTHKIVMPQDDPGLDEAVAALAPGGCDLIVDDASHLAEQTQKTFLSLWPLVKPGRYYVVEDWTTALGLGEWVANLIRAVNDGAASVTYTREGLVIVKRAVL